MRRLAVAAVAAVAFVAAAFLLLSRLHNVEPYSPSTTAQRFSYELKLTASEGTCCW